MEIVDKLQKLLGNVHREMEILIIGQKEMLDIKKYNNKNEEYL